MSFERVTIAGLDDLFEFLKSKRSRRMIYRGQSLASWALEPSIFRPSVVVARDSNERVQKEREMLRSFKKRARFLIPDRPPYQDDWQWLALARHYELPTRLLDWSESAGVALYFAVRKKQEGIESVLWCSEKPDVVKTTKADPFEVKGILLYEPEHIAARIFVQRSCFTIHPTNYRDTYLQWPCGLTQAVITASARKPIRNMLYDLGIDHSLLCPEPNAIADALREAYGAPIDELPATPTPDG